VLDLALELGLASIVRSTVAVAKAARTADERASSGRARSERHRKAAGNATAPARRSGSKRRLAAVVGLPVAIGEISVADVPAAPRDTDGDRVGW
jgi:hypothetical protein